MARLVTLVGPPGAGKSRLAVEVAAAAAELFPDGVHFVPLAAVADPSSVLPTVAQVLGVREVPGRPLTDTIAGALGERRLLLVLDNAEHVASAGTALAELLTACSGPRALVTSREALRVSGEHVLVLHPLPVPDHPTEVDVPTLLASDAVRLFVDRARADPRREPR
jgi:predicted ATPase